MRPLYSYGLSTSLRSILFGLVLLSAFATAPLTTSTSAQAAPVCDVNASKNIIGGAPGASFMKQSDADLGRDLGIARNAGMSAIRLDFDWSSIEASRGNRNWANIDRVVNAVAANGLCPLGLLAYTPLWATNPADRATDTHFRPNSAAEFADFARAAADRYRSIVKVWEIWNEPNTVNFFKPAPNVNSYGELLAASYPAIKSVDPNLVVISGGFSPAVDNGTNIAPPTFLSRLYAAGFNKYLDGVGMHPFTYPYLPNDPSIAGWSAAQQMWPMRDTMVAGGDAGKRIWITECGAPTGWTSVSVSAKKQADTIGICVNAGRTPPWLGPSFIYSLRYSGGNIFDPEQNFGIVYRNFTPKAAYTMLRQLATAG